MKKLGCAFEYEQAFSRTRGWVTREEQEILRNKRIAIAGLGGVGGLHLLTLARLGIGSFHIADFDVFELANFNRQAGAALSHLGRPKVDVLSEMARDINPEAAIQRFPEGVNDANLGKFLEGADLYMDGLDFFAVKARRAVFAECARRGIPAITAGPIGMGAALLVFMPGKMTFEEYFRLEGCSEDEQLLRFMVGLVPAMGHRKYLVDPSTVDLKRRKGPSTPMGCALAAGAAGTEALKILLGRGKILPAPHAFQFDVFQHRIYHTWRAWGNRNPLQRLLLRLVRRDMERRS